ncbi:MAG: uroporphyrinogen decarboxylase, partial [Proteobacteria bacterium]|nr:uroporphyrinogen decarboxylase [Pseudomonadota bacterium]
RSAIEAVLTEGAALPVPHIFNVGHGLTPDANPDTVARTIETVHQYKLG